MLKEKLKGPSSSRNLSDIKILLAGFKETFELVVQRKHQLALICYHVKRISELTCDELAIILSVITGGVLTRSWISRLVRIGKTIVQYPETQRISDQEVLVGFSRLEKERKSEILKSNGYIVSDVSIFDSSRAMIQQEFKNIKGNSESNLFNVCQAFYDLAKETFEFAKREDISQKYPDASEIASAMGQFLVYYLRSNEKSFFEERHEKSQSFKDLFNAAVLAESSGDGHTTIKDDHAGLVAKASMSMFKLNDQLYARA